MVLRFFRLVLIALKSSPVSHRAFTISSEGMDFSDSTEPSDV